MGLQLAMSCDISRHSGINFISFKSSLFITNIKAIVTMSIKQLSTVLLRSSALVSSVRNGARRHISTRPTLAAAVVAGGRSMLRTTPLSSNVNVLNSATVHQKRSMFIQTTPTPNDDALKFLPSQEVLPATFGTLEYVSGRDAHSSPLARKLFAVDGIRSVMFGSDFITVEKDSDSKWMILKPEIFSILTEHLSSGLPVIIEGTAANSDTEASDSDTEIVSMIKELIDTRIRPAIQEDGGDLQYRGFTDDGIVQLKLQGACRSCDSSSVTLKNGIEAMLMHYVEEVTGVEQVLDPEEEASLNAFEKLEQKLSGEKGQQQQQQDLEAPPAL